MKASEFQLINQRLVASSFKINKNYKKEEIKLDINTKVNIAKSNTDNLASVTLILEIFKEEDLENNPYYIKLEIEGHFEWRNIENIEQYLQVNAPAVLFSYLRSIIIQLTVMSGFPPLNLPLINFNK